MKRLFLLAVAVAVSLPGPLRAEVKLPNMIGSHMVVQRDAPIRVWGWATAGEAVTVKFAGQEMAIKAGEDGTWQVALNGQAANSKGQKLTITGTNIIVLEDVLVGDVWVGSGQSNMAWALASTLDGIETILAAYHPTIRLYHVPKVQTPTPAENIDAHWRPTTPETVPNFSSVLFYFALALRDGGVAVPLGLINSSWGGSQVEPWFVESGPMCNAMIAPLAKAPIKGFLWYQGESNVTDGMSYRDKKNKLISGWRKLWKNDRLPFYYVQIAPFRGYGDGHLPALWEAQTALLATPRTGMAVITDCVENIDDIHPQTKTQVGQRLARWALAKDYGQEDVFSSPLYKSMAIEGTKIRITFAHAQGLQSRDGETLRGFMIAGIDGKFVPALALIDGRQVLVSSDQVANPAQVRFGWHKSANPNICNGAGLPASPFRTHQWQGVTAE